jgi:hypothetical protein
MPLTERLPVPSAFPRLDEVFRDEFCERPRSTLVFFEMNGDNWPFY